MSETIYNVKVCPCRVGHLASVGKRTLLSSPREEPFWLGWEPEPSYWRPAEGWAVRRATRKRARLLAADARRASRKEVVGYAGGT